MLVYWLSRNYGMAFLIVVISLSSEMNHIEWNCVNYLPWVIVLSCESKRMLNYFNIFFGGYEPLSCLEGL